MNSLVGILQGDKNKNQMFNFPKAMEHNRLYLKQILSNQCL